MESQNVITQAYDVNATIAYEGQKRAADGKWPVWAYGAGHPAETDGHLWRYLGGEWFDTVRKCRQCGVIHFHFRCWSGSRWVVSPNNILGSYQALAKEKMPWIFEQFGHIPSGDVQPCPKAEHSGEVGTGQPANGQPATTPGYAPGIHGFAGVRDGFGAGQSAGGAHG